MARLRASTFRAPGRGARWTAESARAALAAWEKSDLPATVFAREHGFDPQRLYWWRRRARNGAALGLEPIRFEEVGLEDAAGERDGTDTRFEIELRGGPILRVPESFDDSTLRRLLAVVRGQGGPC